MAKLCANMTYNQRFYQESNIITPNSELLVTPQDDSRNQDDNMAETETNILPLIQEDEEILENDDSDYDEDIETVSKKFDENLTEWLEILKDIEEKSKFLDIDIEDIEHSAQNHNAKWNLDLIFKNDLCCPF